MYGKTYLIVKRLFVEFHRLKYQHVDEPDIYNKTKEIIEKLQDLEKLLKTRIED